MGDAARDRMMGEMAAGGDCASGDDASGKVVLARGCDPVMAERAGTMLPPMLGNVKVLSATDDDTFFELLGSIVVGGVVLLVPAALLLRAQQATWLAAVFALLGLFISISGTYISVSDKIESASG